MKNKKIINCLLKKDIRPNIKGFRCLYYAIDLVVKNDGILLPRTKVIYPKVAEICNDTASKVERAIRHAIETSSKSSLTNGEFIALCALEVME